MKTEIKKQAVIIRKEAIRIRKEFAKNGMYWTTDDCIESLKEKYPYNTFNIQSFKLAYVLQQNYILN